MNHNISNSYRNLQSHKPHLPHGQVEPLLTKRHVCLLIIQHLPILGSLVWITLFSQNFVVVQIVFKPYPRYYLFVISYVILDQKIAWNILLH